MPEEFLQYIWENRLFTTGNNKTTAGEDVNILSTGKRNSDAGPDFFNALIELNGTIWAGNIEIHKKSSDWLKHKHDTDTAYSNVILHVVEIADMVIHRANGEEIPTLELNYPEHLRTNYQSLLNAKTWIACQSRFYRFDPVLLQLGFHRLMIERLEQKTIEINTRLWQNNNDWNETFYQVLARMYGFKVNALPFEMLAKSLPIHILAKHKNSLFTLEALLFGNSGLLNNQLLGDDYYLQLRNEYSFFYRKYKLSPIESHLWKFLRLRPVNFPTIRIAQFAALIFRSQGLLSKITETAELNELKKMFRVKASEYWDNHYTFNKPSNKKNPKELGESSANTIILNVIIPFLFVYGEKQNQTNLKNRALDFLEQLPPEENSVITGWKKLGIDCRSAFESQALIHLKSRYCEKKKCLNCQIGVKIVQDKP